MSKVVLLRLAGASCLLLVVLAYLRWPLWPDHSFFLYMGASWHKGILPYRDLFDQNWPGIIWISQMITAWVGPTPLGVRVFDVIWQALSAVTLFFIARKYLSKQFALVTVYFYLALYLAASFGSTAQREGFASLFLGAAMLLLDNTKTRLVLIRAIAAGLLLAAGIFIKPTLGTIPACLCLYYLFRLTRGKEQCRGLMAGVIIGTLAPLVFYLLYLVQTGTLSYFVEAAVFATKYVNVSVIWSLRRLLVFLVVYPPGRLIIICSILAVLIWRKKLRMPARYGLPAVFVLGSLISLMVQRRLAYYHSMPFCYFGSLFVIVAACGGGFPSDPYRGSVLKRLCNTRILTCLLLVFICPIGIDLPRSVVSFLSGQSAAEYGDSQRIRRGLAPWSLVEQVGEIVRSYSDETLLVLCIADSDSPDYYLAADCRPMDRYINPTQLRFDQNRLDEALAQVRFNRNPMIMIVRSKTLVSSQLFLEAATEGADAECIFRTDYGDGLTVSVYYLARK